MNKKKIFWGILGVVLVGLIIFASTYKYKDSHFRKEGVRVRLDEYALEVDRECDQSDIATCLINLDVNGEKEKLVFEYINFQDNGFPETLVATINGKEIFRKDNLDFTKNTYYDYFSHVNVIGDKVVFTYTDGSYSDGRSTVLYAVNKDGEKVLEESIIGDNDMKIKDYSYYDDFATVEDNVITLYTSRLNYSNYIGEDYICDVKSSDVVEAYYTYTYKDGEFVKKLDKKITAKEYIANNEISCS